MTWHPLVLAIGLLDLMAGAIYLSSAWRLLWILPHWRPELSDADQLGRERALALVVYQGRWVMALQAVALVALVLGIGNSWTAHVPGAMCGTGVLQALGPAGRQTLLLRLLTLWLLYCWHVVTRIDDHRPEAHLALVHGRLLLLAAPLPWLSAWRLGRAVAAVRSQEPVSCCAALYEQVGAAGLGGAVTIPAWMWAWACFAGALLLAAWGLFQWRRPSSAGARTMGVAAGLTLAWIGAAFMGLKTTVSAYIFEVLYHPCPWCLFLWDHGGVGFVYFGLLAWIAAQSMAGLTAAAIARHHPPLAAASLSRVGRAGGHLCLGALLFALLAAAPALIWRARFGGWITP